MRHEGQRPDRKFRLRRRAGGDVKHLGQRLIVDVNQEHFIG